MPLAASAFTIAALPPEVCAEVCAALASSEEGGIDDLKAASLAAKLLREPAARAVTRLVDRDGSLPACAWDCFPEARGLVVQLEEEPDEEAVQRLPGQLSQLAARLPQRLERVTFEQVPGTYQHLNDSAKLTGPFVQGLVAGPCAGSLKEVALRLYVSPATAEVLLSQLPRLQRLELRLYASGQGTMELSSYPASLLDLELRWWGPRFTGAAALVASPCAGSLTRLSLAGDMSAPEVDVLLRGLPALEQLALDGCMYSSQEPAQPVRLSSFPATLQQLELYNRLSNYYNHSFILDAAALAACCPQLRTVRLLMSQLCNIGSISSWAALESLELYLFCRGPEPLQQLAAAASQLQQLQRLKLPALEVSTSSQLWAQLASMPALRSLALETLHVDSVAAPSASIRRLKADLRLRQLPAEQLDGCLAVLLPGLEQLESSLLEDNFIGSTVARVMSALRSHPMLHQLSLSSMNNPSAQPWGQQQTLRSMPRLRALNLSKVQPGLLGALLEDASGCGQLQELRLVIEATHATSPLAGSSCGPGLAALASGPCRHSLRSIKVQFLVAGDQDTGHLPTPAHAAALLQQGALPALRELRLDVLLHAGGLLPRRSERLRRASRGGAAAAGRQPPPVSTEQRLQLLERELRQAGVQGVCGLRRVSRMRGISLGLSSDHDDPWLTCFEGCVRRCRYSGLLWVQW
jgi:hypothetical protein